MALSRKKSKNAKNHQVTKLTKNKRLTKMTKLNKLKKTKKSISQNGGRKKRTKSKRKKSKKKKNGKKRVKQVGGMEVDASTAGNEVILSDPKAKELLLDMDRLTEAYIATANIEINDETLEVINADRHFNSQSFQQFKNGIKKITDKIPVSDESQPAFDTFESYIQDSLETVFSGTDSRTRWYEFIVNIMNSIFGFFSQYNKPTRSQAILIIRIFYFCRGYIDAISRERRKAMLDHAGDMERRTAMEKFLSLEQMHFTTTQKFSNTELYKQEIEKRRYLPTASIIQDPRTNTHYRELMMCIGCGEFADQQLKKVLGLFKTGIELQFIEYEQMVEEVKKLETAFLIDPTNLAKTQERLRSISSSSPAGMPLQGPPVQFVNVEQPEAAGMESSYGAAFGPAGAAALGSHRAAAAPMPAATPMPATVRTAPTKRERRKGGHSVHSSYFGSGRGRDSDRGRGRRGGRYNQSRP